MQNCLLTFGTERFKVVVFKEPTTKEVRRLMRQRFGNRGYKITQDGIFTRQPGRSWQLFASDLEEAISLIK